ncbi:serine hydrolase domain-containing protein [Variovorax terrae]|uniref:Beta-lactamase family protein n=1 Tax=Variovorax terrae TaxID=2923278 RepID=A0A9X1VV40_9BURK|nr:serine hydrolase domain-containing protein [Variovorax terrae]MCJ0763825.1 beta-lactamase family protein [Variovorax terrae]
MKNNIPVAASEPPARRAAIWRRLAGLLILGAAVAACGGGSSSPSVSLNLLVRQPVDDQVYPGVSVAVGNAASGLLASAAAGWADLGKRVPLTADSPMRMASVSKSVTAVAILMLDQAGKVSLDAPVGTYVPEYTAHGHEITLRQLLSHTSGIGGHDHGDPVIHGDGPITEAQFFARLNALALYAVPGKSWDYSNENYYLLAKVVERVSGLTFADWLNRNVFQPAGMTVRSYADEGQANPAVPLGYVHRLKTDPFIQCPAPDWSGMVGGGGIIATPGDMVRFDVAVFGGKLLDAAHRAEMVRTVADLGGGLGYALGWFTYPQGIVKHDGDFTTATTSNTIFPDGTFVVQAANGADLAPDFDRLYFATQVQNLYGKTPLPLGKPNPASLLHLFGPFTTCQQMDDMLYPPPK